MNSNESQHKIDFFYHLKKPDNFHCIPGTLISQHTHSFINVILTITKICNDFIHYYHHHRHK